MVYIFTPLYLLHDLKKLTIVSSYSWLLKLAPKILIMQRQNDTMKQAKFWVEGLRKVNWVFCLGQEKQNTNWNTDRESNRVYKITYFSNSHKAYVTIMSLEFILLSSLQSFWRLVLLNKYSLNAQTNIIFKYLIIFYTLLKKIKQNLVI